MGSLLFDTDDVLLVGRNLAKLIGLHESIVLQQVHYWLNNITKSNDKDYQQQHYINGRFWTYNTYEEWQVQFPFWTVLTIKRTVAKLEKSGYLISGCFNKKGFDRTKWYTIDYDKINEAEAELREKERMEAEEKRLKLQELQESIKMIRPMTVSKRYDLLQYQNDTTYTKDSIPKTSLTKKSYKASFPKGKDVSSHKDEVIEEQVGKWCIEHGYEYDKEIANIINHFIHEFEKKYGVPHGHIKQRQIGKIVKAIIHGFYTTSEQHIDWYDMDLYRSMIHDYFERDDYCETLDKECDHRIYHFMDDDVRRILYERSK